MGDEQELELSIIYFENFSFIFENLIYHTSQTTQISLKLSLLVLM